MSELPVINYGRMERLRLPDEDTFNLNMMCVIFICIIVLGLYKRSVDIRQSRERSYILRL